MTDEMRDEIFQAFKTDGTEMYDSKTVTAMIRMGLEIASRKPNWYISFVGGDGFLGACMVYAPTLETAWAASHILGCNPGGEAEFVEIPDHLEANIPLEYCAKLLSREDIDAFDRAMGVGR